MLNYLDDTYDILGCLFSSFMVNMETVMRMSYSSILHPQMSDQKVGLRSKLGQSSAPSFQLSLIALGWAPESSYASKSHIEYFDLGLRELDQYLLSGKEGNACHSICHVKKTWWESKGDGGLSASWPLL